MLPEAARHEDHRRRRGDSELTPSAPLSDYFQFGRSFCIRFHSASDAACCSAVIGCFSFPHQGVSALPVQTEVAHIDLRLIPWAGRGPEAGRRAWFYPYQAPGGRETAKTLILPAWVHMEGALRSQCFGRRADPDPD